MRRRGVRETNLLSNLEFILNTFELHILEESTPESNIPLFIHLSRTFPLISLHSPAYSVCLIQLKPNSTANSACETQSTWVHRFNLRAYLVRKRWSKEYNSMCICIVMTYQSRPESVRRWRYQHWTTEQWDTSEPRFESWIRSNKNTSSANWTSIWNGVQYIWSGYWKEIVFNFHDRTRWAALDKRTISQLASIVLSQAFAQALATSSILFLNSSHRIQPANKYSPHSLPTT